MYSADEYNADNMDTCDAAQHFSVVPHHRSQDAVLPSQGRKGAAAPAAAPPVASGVAAAAPAGVFALVMSDAGVINDGAVV